MSIVWAYGSAKGTVSVPPDLLRQGPVMAISRMSSTVGGLRVGSIAGPSIYPASTIDQSTGPRTPDTNAPAGERCQRKVVNAAFSSALHLQKPAPVQTCVRHHGEAIMKSVVVTGASTGIGWATAKLLLDRGFRVFGSVRKQADADRLRREFGVNFTPLIFDVTDEAAVLAAAREVRSALAGETLAGLVNNAGIAVAGPVLELAADEFRRQMDVNFIGPVIATQAFGPLLGSDPTLKGPKGRIVMISSVAGKNGNPLTSAYAASKHAIEG